MNKRSNSKNKNRIKQMESKKGGELVKKISLKQTNKQNKIQRNRTNRIYETKDWKYNEQRIIKWKRLKEKNNKLGGLWELSVGGPHWVSH